MSIEHALTFLKRVVSDGQLQEQIATLTSIDEPERERALVTVSKGVGFDFSPEELIQALKISNGEMPEQELRAVAGGVLTDSASQPLLQPSNEISVVTGLQRETAAFTSIVNILKAKRDVTNSILNIK